LFLAMGRLAAEDINQGSDPDIPDDFNGAAVSAKIGANDAWLNTTGRIYQSGNFYTGTGWVEANVLGAGTGVVRSRTETVTHSPFQFETNGNSCQSLKPMTFGSSQLPDGSSVNTSIDMHFDGLLVAKELLTGAGIYTEARVEYMAEIQRLNSLTGTREIFGDNTFDGVARLVDNGTTCTVEVPETYTWMPEEGADANSWYNNPGLQILRVVSGAAGPGEISVNDLPADSQAEAAIQVAAGRNIYYLVYDQTFSFEATVGDTYFMAMDLLTAAGSFGNSDQPSYALSDFSNTITYQFSGVGLDLSTVVIISGNETIGSADPFGGSSSTLVLAGGNLTWTGNYNLTSPISLESGTTNVFNVGTFGVALSGVLSGSGTLQKLGTGTLTVSGSTDSFAGGIALNAGTLAIDNATNTTLSGAISGSGTLQKLGAGRLNLTGNSSGFAGATQVNAGTLAVNGSLGGSIAVANGATLQGSGSIGGDVTNQGRIAPGNSIGTLTVAGNYTHAAGATHQVEINDAGQSDLLVVGGTADLQGGTLQVVPENRITDNREYRFLTAAGGITGDFSVFDTALIDFTAEKRAGDTEYWLMASSQAFSSYAGTANQAAVARYMDQLYASASGDLGTVMASLETLNATGLRQSLDQLSGELYGALPVVGRDNTSFLYSLLTNRLRANVFNPVALPDENGATPRWTGWAVGYGRGGQVYTDGNAHGFDYSVGGTLVALDRIVSEDTRVGLFYNYTQAFVDTTGGLENYADMKSHHWGGYLTRLGSESYLTVAAGAGYDSYETTRRVSFGPLYRNATANNHGWQSSARMEYGRIYGSQQLNLQPFMALQHIYVRQSNVAETGANALDLNVGGVDLDALRTILGGRLVAQLQTSRLGTPDLEFRTYWIHELLDEAATIDAQLAGTSSAFRVRGVDLGRDWVVLGPGVNWRIGDNCRLFADYDLHFNSALAYHTGSGGVEFTW
jgi:autotransporter-associated beta strand protein